MKNNKLETITNLFEGNEIRSMWDKEKEDYYFSIIDVIEVLTESPNPRNYWNMLKSRLALEGSELYTNCVQLKMTAKDGKQRNTDVLDTKGILRLIESVPSKKAEPFKMWLASLGKERIDEVFNPEISINRAINYYRKRGNDEKWIESRLKSIIDRNKLTNVWKESGINKPVEFAILTNEIYKSWSGMKASEYKEFKGIRKESLRDNMTNYEVILTDLGEALTREFTKEKEPNGLKENKEVAKIGGSIAKITRDNIEKEINRSVISKENSLGYRYIEDNKKIENKSS